MRLFPAIARLIGGRRARKRRHLGPDFADMGTAFGLDAITTLDELPAAQAPPSTLQRRIDRRSRL